MLYAFGDSHARVLDGVPGVVCCHVGPVTMFRLGHRGELDRLFRSICPYVDPRDSILVFCGEIDVRVHFGRLGKDQPHEHAARLVSSFLAELSAWSAKLGCRVAVASVTPPAEVESSPDFPVSGSMAERVQWTQMLNSALASDGRVPFVDFTSPYADGCGELARDVVDDSVHIQPRWNAGVVEAVQSARLLEG